MAARTRTRNGATSDDRPTQTPTPGTTGVSDMTTNTETSNQSKRSTSAAKPTLSPEVVELLQELRDTVRRIDAKRHTPTSLRRTLVNVSSILEDIQVANGPKPANGVAEAKA